MQDSIEIIQTKAQKKRIKGSSRLGSYICEYMKIVWKEFHIVHIWKYICTSLEKDEKENGIEDIFEEKMAEFFQNWCKNKSTGTKNSANHKQNKYKESCT